MSLHTQLFRNQATNAARRGETLLPNSAATPLPAAQRTWFEARLGQDFSQVRVHTDDAAAQSAKALGANAFASGNAIAFAAGAYQPESAQGQRLLAHELLHVAQQQRGSGDSVLAESRAAQGAEALAQGEHLTTSEQGTASTGVYCDDSEDEKKQAQAATAQPAAPQPFIMPSPLLRPTYTMPQSFGSIPPVLTPPVAPYKLMQNADLLAPFSVYGTIPGMAGMDLHADWGKAYFMFRNYLPESLAATAATTALSTAYQANFAFNQPSIFDKSALDFKAAYPDEKHTPIIPFLSSGTMTTIYEKITGKKNTDAFYF